MQGPGAAGAGRRLSALRTSGSRRAPAPRPAPPRPSRLIHRRVLTFQPAPRSRRRFPGEVRRSRRAHSLMAFQSQKSPQENFPLTSHTPDVPLKDRKPPTSRILQGLSRRLGERTPIPTPPSHPTHPPPPAINPTPSPKPGADASRSPCGTGGHHPARGPRSPVDTKRSPLTLPWMPWCGERPLLFGTIRRRRRARERAGAGLSARGGPSAVFNAGPLPALPPASGVSPLAPRRARAALRALIRVSALLRASCSPFRPPPWRSAGRAVVGSEGGFPARAPPRGLREAGGHRASPRTPVFAAGW